MIYRNENSKILGRRKPAVTLEEIILYPILLVAGTLLVIGIMCL